MQPLIPPTYTTILAGTLGLIAFAYSINNKKIVLKIAEIKTIAPHQFFLYKDNL